MPRIDLKREWEENREGMLQRLQEARERRKEKALAENAAFQSWLERQGEAIMRDKEQGSQRRYFEVRCTHCGNYLQAPTRSEYLETIAPHHGEGVCTKEKQQARKRTESKEGRRAKTSRTLAHKAAIMGVSITGEEGSERV